MMFYLSWTAYRLFLIPYKDILFHFPCGMFVCLDERWLVFDVCAYRVMVERSLSLLSWSHVAATTLTPILSSATTINVKIVTLTS